MEKKKTKKKKQDKTKKKELVTAIAMGLAGDHEDLDQDHETKKAVELKKLVDAFKLNTGE